MPVQLGCAAFEGQDIYPTQDPIMLEIGDTLYSPLEAAHLARLLLAAADRASDHDLQPAWKSVASSGVGLRVCGTTTAGLEAL
jgi:hypothetical protein